MRPALAQAHAAARAARAARRRIARRLAGVLVAACAAAAAAAPLPQRLSATGLFVRGQPDRPGAGVVAFTPQHALWSDGATKRRWIALPPGRAIDARQPDAWAFPPGTRLWKEFAHGGRPVETRYIERQADGRWRFATYLWAADGRDALLAPAAGVAALPVDAAPDGRYAVPSRDDCRVCHESAAVPVLGVSAVQLAPELAAWVAAGRLRGLPAALRQRVPQIAAASALEREALGTLHANCGHCHNRSGHQVPLALTLAQRAADPEASRRELLASVLGVRGRFRPGGAALALVEPGASQRSLLVQRMATRDPQRQMPPLGTRHADTEGLVLVARWIDHTLADTSARTGLTPLIDRKEPRP